MVLPPFRLSLQDQDIKNSSLQRSNGGIGGAGNGGTGGNTEKAVEDGMPVGSKLHSLWLQAAAAQVG